MWIFHVICFVHFMFVEIFSYNSFWSWSLGYCNENCWNFVFSCLNSEKNDNNRIPRENENENSKKKKNLLSLIPLWKIFNKSGFFSRKKQRWWRVMYRFICPVIHIYFWISSDLALLFCCCSTCSCFLPFSDLAKAHYKRTVLYGRESCVCVCV